MKKLLLIALTAISTAYGTDYDFEYWQARHRAEQEIIDRFDEAEFERQLEQIDQEQRHQEIMDEIRQRRDLDWDF